MSELRIIAEGLKFPEGPVAMADGSVVLTELAGGTLTRVAADGTVSTVAKTGGGPNGAAVGPGGAFFVCNNGGSEYRPGTIAAVGPAKDYAGGSIQVVDPGTGDVRVLYDRCGDHKLSSPNDLVFDAHGGFYFSDMGKRHPRYRDHGGIYYATPDGKRITEVAHPTLTANGVGLSPDGGTLYFAETETSRLWSYEIIEPGVVRKEGFPSPNGGRLVCGLPGFQRFDSLAVDAHGNICVATLMTGHITVIAPDGKVIRQVKVPDVYPTNICFGGSDLRTAYITLTASGRLGVMEWPEPGLKLHYQVL